MTSRHSLIREQDLRIKGLQLDDCHGPKFAYHVTRLQALSASSMLFSGITASAT